MCLYGTGLLIITPSRVGENQPSLGGKLPGRRELLLPAWGWTQAASIFHTQLPSVSTEGDGWESTDSKTPLLWFESCPRHLLMAWPWENCSTSLPCLSFPTCKEMIIYTHLGGLW